MYFKFDQVLDEFEAKALVTEMPDGTTVEEFTERFPGTKNVTIGETTALLLKYVNDKRDDLANGGFSFNVGGVSNPTIVHADTDAGGRADLVGLVNLAGLDPAFTTTWDQVPGGVLLNAEQMTSLAVAVGKFRSAVFSVASKVKSDVVAREITTRAEINAAEWPSNEG